MTQKVRPGVLCALETLARDCLAISVHSELPWRFKKKQKKRKRKKKETNNYCHT